MRIHRLNDHVSVLADHMEVPGLGHLPVNAFVLHAAEPVVIDTGLGLPDRDFVRSLAAAVDPATVAWIWLTHPDRDHTGGLFDLLAAAPDARVVTTFGGVGIMSTERPLPMDRLYLLNPGQTLEVGDRTLTAVRPPLFDNPVTVGVFDDRSRTYFSSDCFGGPMPTAAIATCDSVADLATANLRASQLLWAAFDSPWVHMVDREAFADSLTALRDLDPSLVLSTHLPPVAGRLDELLHTLAAAPDAEPFVGPDQAKLERMLA
jgi:glyoxylase-like metal-dependent hydrolase (beta-lactamase superfamily II)